jgi:hypothetical protein
MEPIRFKEQQTSARRTSIYRSTSADGGADEGLALVKSRTSAIRYVDTQGNQVIRRGNQQFVMHDDPPPNRRPHWLVISGLSMMVLIALWAGLSWVASWIATNQVNATYEYPRVSQADAVVYPGDTSEHPSHYLFLNLNGTVLIVELPHGDSAKARIYKGPTLFSDNANQIPVTGEFRVVNGKIEMLVHIQDQVILYVNDGTEFKAQ